jgi:hypothetical protein
MGAQKHLYTLPVLVASPTAWRALVVDHDRASERPFFARDTRTTSDTAVRRYSDELGRRPVLIDVDFAQGACRVPIAPSLNAD